MDIIMLASARWDGPYSSSAYSLAKEFAKKNRVFYLDNPITIKYFLAKYSTDQIKRRKKALLFGKGKFHKLSSSGEGELIAVTAGLTIPVNFLPAGFLYEQLSGINDWIISGTLKQLLKEYSIKEFIFINSFNPFFLRKFPSFFKPKLFVYITVDDISQSLHVDKHGPQLEEEMIRRAQLTLTTSTELKKLKSTFTTSIDQLPNAADVSLFKKSLDPSLPIPKEIEGIVKPIIIYTGHIDSRVDEELLKFIFQSHPDKCFLMVGPISLDPNLLKNLQSIGNSIFTGKKDISELPAYLRQAKCAIIPFKRNVLTKSIYPLKINEYLAAGKPVVSTNFSEDIADFKEVILIQNEYEAFSSEINIALKDDTQEKINQRIKFVENNTWQARVDQFWKITKKYFK